jgi:hypothetical protein
VNGGKDDLLLRRRFHPEDPERIEISAASGLTGAAISSPAAKYPDEGLRDACDRRLSGE